MDTTYTGTLQISVVSALGMTPIPGATVTVSYTGDPDSPLETMTTDESGQTPTITLDAPPRELSLSPDITAQPYSEYNIQVTAEGFEPVLVSGSEILAGEFSLQPIRRVAQKGTTNRSQIVIPFVFNPSFLFGQQHHNVIASCHELGHGVGGQGCMLELCQIVQLLADHFCILTILVLSNVLYRYGNCSTFISGACSAICDRETLAKAMPPYLICSSTSLSEPSFASLSTMMWIRPPVRSCTSSAKPQRYPTPHLGAIDSLRRLCDRCRSRPKFPADASALPFHPSILPSTFPPVKSPSQSLCSYIIFYIFQSVITKYS